MTGESALDAIESLYVSRYGHLVGLAEWLLGSRALAEEIVQDAFARLISDPPSLREPGALEAYVRSSVMNRSRSRVRRLIVERRHGRSRPEDGRPDTYSDEPVRAAVAELPVRQRQCVVLRFYEDMTVAQIAHTLGLRPGTVKSHLHRAMTSLETILKEAEK